MSDTPTYDQLCALCAQMAAALEAVQKRFFMGGASQDEMCPQITAALTAYRTLSPEPQWLEREKQVAAREGWMRACVHYNDIHAEGDPAVIAEADKRWPLTANRARGEG